jgi:hypothetical protein
VARAFRVRALLAVGLLALEQRSFEFAVEPCKPMTGRAPVSLGGSGGRGSGRKQSRSSQVLRSMFVMNRQRARRFARELIVQRG